MPKRLATATVAWPLPHAIRYEGPETFAERNRQYWDSPKREAMVLDPQDYLVSTDVREVTRVY